MAAPVGSLVVRIGSDIRGLSRGAREGRRSMRRLSEGARGASQTMRRLAAAAVAAAAAVGAVKLGRSFLDAASKAEQLRVRLRVLLGSVEEGNRLFDSMRKFASRVPFEFEEIMESATTLAGIMRGGVEEINKWMPLIGDLAATTGLSIRQTTEQVQRMLSAGAASADLFRERGVLAMLGFQAGVTVSAEETRKRLMEAWQATNSQFRGATQLLAQTWEGAMSMLSDKWFQFRTQVMEAGLFNHLKAMATVIDRDLGNAMDENRTLAKRMSDSIITAMEVGARGVGFLSDAFRGLQLIVKAVDLGFAGLQLLIGKVLAIAEESIRMFVNNSIAAVNLLIQGLNKIPKVNIALVEELRRGSFAEEIETMTARARLRVAGLRVELQELATAPMPSEGITEFFRRVREEAERTGGAVAKVTGGGGGAGSEETDREEEARLEKLREQVSQRLEVIREGLLSERELEQEAFLQKMEDLRVGLELELITFEEFRQRKEELERQHQERLNEIERQGLTDREKFERATMAQRVQTVASHLAQLTSIVAGENKRMFQINKAAAIATAIMEAYQGIQKTWNAYPYPWNIPMAAAHAATAFLNVQRIKSQSFGGGGGGAPSVSAATPAGATATTGTTGNAAGAGGGGGNQVVNIALQGDRFGREQVRELIDEINDAVADGARLRVV